MGDMPFGEKLMLKIMRKSKATATMKDYYNESEEQRGKWKDEYMNMCLTRTLIMGCANKNVRKDLDKFVRVGSAKYPSRFEGATGLIL